MASAEDGDDNDNTNNDTLKEMENNSAQLADLEVQKIVQSGITDEATAQSKVINVALNIYSLWAGFSSFKSFIIFAALVNCLDGRNRHIVVTKHVLKKCEFPRKVLFHLDC